MKKNIISIITICFNSEETIALTIDSVLNQSFSGFDYTIIDGRSTDNTIEIIKSYQTQFEQKNIRFNWISEKDNGIYDAMNKGINFSNGKWLIFMNSGDYFVNKNILERIYKQYLVQAEFDVLSGKVNIVDEKGISLGYTHPNQTGDIKRLLKENCVAHQATFIKREMFELYGHYEKFKIHMDYDYWIRLLSKGAKFKFIDDVIANFNNSGVSSNRANYLTALNEQLEIFHHYGYLSNTKKALIKISKSIIFHLKSGIRFLVGRDLAKKMHLYRLRRK